MICALENLSLTLKNQAILSNLTYSFHPHQVTAIIGRSGSGKSCLAKIIAGSLKASQGKSILPMARRGQPAVHYVWQDAPQALHPFRRIRTQIIDMLRFQTDLSTRQRRERAEYLLAEVGLPDICYDKRPGDLSGGQCQRVAFARALASASPILIFDEPFSALDLLSQIDLLACLKKIKQTAGRTILLISHDLGNLPGLADHILVLDQGLIIESGTVEMILTHPQHPLTRAFIAAAQSDFGKPVKFVS